MRAAIYVRVSTSAQASEDKDSLPEQGRELMALRAGRGWQAVQPPAFEGREALPPGVFGDPGITGDTVEGRPGMMALLEAVRAGKVDAVMVRDTNRLARHELAAQQIHAVFEAHGVLLVTPTMDYDYGNLQHRLMLGLLGSIEAYAKRWLVMNMKRAREAKARQGKWGLSARRPYGYHWDKQAKRPVVASDEAETVRLIYQLTEEGLPAQAIARHLNSEGVETRYRARWYGSQIMNVLRDPVYMGRWETAPGVAANEPPEALVTPEQWQRAQTLRQHHRKRTRRTLQHEFLLTGLAFCGHCGSVLTGRVIGGRGVKGRSAEPYRYYGCGAGIAKAGTRRCPAKYILTQDLDDGIWSLVARLVACPDLVVDFAKEAEERQLPEWRSRLERARKLVEYAAVKSERAWQAYVNGYIGQEEYGDKRAAIDGERARAASDAEGYQRLVEDAEFRMAAVNRVKQIAEGLRGNMDVLTLEDKRRVLLRLGFRITAWSDDWTRPKRGGPPRQVRARAEWAGQTFVEREELYAESYTQS